jgi:hypothetical protein
LLDPTREPPADLLNFNRDDPVFIVPPFDMRPRSLGFLQIEKILGQLSQFEADQAVHSMQLEFVQPLSLVLGGEIYPLRNVLTLVDIVPHTHAVKALLNACHRSTDDTIIALTGTAEITMKDKRMIIIIIAKRSECRGYNVYESTLL